MYQGFYEDVFCSNCGATSFPRTQDQKSVDFSSNFYQHCGTRLECHHIPKCGACRTELASWSMKIGEMYSFCPGCGLNAEKALVAKDHRTLWQKFRKSWLGY